MSKPAVGPSSDWAPAPSPFGNSEPAPPGPATRGSLSPFRIIFWGLIIVGFDLRVDGFDLLVDAAGYGLVAKGASDLANKTAHIVDQAARAFRVAMWAAMVLALFALDRIVVDGQIDPIISTQWTELSFPGSLFKTVSGLVGVALAWYLLTGIADEAKVRELTELAKHAARLRYQIAVAVVALYGVFGLVAAPNLGPFEVLFIVVVVGWLWFRLLSIISQALFELAQTGRTPVEQEPLQTPMAVALGLRPIEVLALATAALIALWSLISPPPVESGSQPFDRPAQFGDEFGRPAEPSPLDEALGRQTPGLIDEPSELSAATPLADRCDAAAEPRLTAVGVADGQHLWSRSIPDAGQAPAVLGQTVLVSDPQLGRLLPSVAGLDVETGQIRWQRHLEAVNVRPWGAANGTASYVVSNPYRAEDGALLLSLDAAGSIVDEVGTELTEWSDLPEARYRPEGPIVKASIGGDDSPRLWLRRLDGSLLQGDEVPLDDNYTSLGNDASLGDAIQIGRDVTIVVLGSPRGPNSLVVAYSNTNGSRLWSQEHLRSAAVATLGGRDVVVYDKRNSNDPDAQTTRSLYVVDALNPDEVLWSAELSVNEQGGNGFLGSTGQGLVFATADDLPADDPKRVRLVTVSQERDAPERLVAAEGYGGGSSSRHIIGPDLVVVAAENTVVVRSGEATVVVDSFDQEVKHVSRAGDTLLVVTWSPRLGCG